MNGGMQYESPAVARWTFLAIMGVALAIIVTALTFGTRPSPSPNQASGSKRLQVPGTVEELGSLTALKGIPLYSLDSVVTAQESHSLAPQAKTPLTVTVRRGQETTVTGWAGDPVSFRPADGVVLEIDGRSLLRAQYGLQRSDVATAFANPAFTATGFTVTIVTGYLAQGLHYVDLIVLNSYGDKYYRIAHRFVLDQT